MMTYRDITKRLYMRMSRFSRMTGAMLLLFISSAGADPLPTGGHITAGSGTISQSGNVMTVTQGSDRMISEWRTFDIGPNARVDFLQPGRSSVALNRILGGNPSQILGALQANGKVYLLNPAGIIFGQSAQVDVGALVASTLELSDRDFLAGRDSFYNSGNAGAILNQGYLQGRVVALLAPQVINAGRITAAHGSAVLAAGDNVTLDFVGDNLLNVTVDKAALSALIDNQGVIEADGGRVIMSARSAGEILGSVVNNDGIVRARSLVERDGMIFLDGGDVGVTRAGGTLDVSAANGTGGSIIVTGHDVLVDDGARLDAGGAQGGGEILIGGGWQGGDPAVRQAHAAVVQRGALLDASATHAGDGGTVVVWSDVNDPGSVTRVRGELRAQGGLFGGDGGRIETSGHGLDAEGITVSTAAPQGRSGLWLIDPSDITISNAGAGSLSGGVFDPAGVDSISPATILAGLAGGDVTIQTSGGSGGSGNIDVVDSIVVAADFGATRTLTLTADGAISFGAGVGVDGTNSNANALNITLTGADIDLSGGVLISPLGTVTLDNTGASTVVEDATTDITADSLLLSGAGASFALRDGTHTVNTLAADTGSIDYLNGAALTIGSVGATDGITATGTVAVATASGDLTVAQDVSTTDTSASALLLNAGENAAAGTAAGGNLIISGSPALSVGTGGIAALYSGSVSGSTGLTALIGSGSGRFRYDSDEAATNYSTALSSGAYAIYREQPTLTVTANNQILTYGTAPTGTSTVTGYQNGDTLAQSISTAATVTGSGTTSTSGNFIVGSHTLTPSAAASGLGYGFNYVDGTLTVNTKALTVTYTGVNKVYDGTTSATVTTSDDRLSGDVLTVNHSESFATNKNVGNSKTIDVTGVSLTGADSANYTVTATGSATANITPRALTVTYTGQNKVYDGTTAAVVTTSDDRVLGDTLTINRSAAFSDKNVGTGKTISVSGVSLSGTDGGNYSVASTGSASANITTRTLLVTYTGVDRQYDGTSNATVTTSDDRVTGDVLTIDRTATFTAGPDVGTGKNIDITGVGLSGTDAANYSVAATGTATADIDPKVLTLAATVADKVYDGDTTASITGYGLSGFIGIETVVASSTSADFADKNAGTGKTVTIGGISLSDGTNGGLASNYTVASSTTATADITPRTLTVTYTGVDRIYDATAAATVTTSDDRVLGDVLTIDRTAAFNDKNVGTGKTVNVSAVSLTGTDAGNYTVASTGSTTADITAKALTAVYSASDKVYDGNALAAVTGSSTDIISGDIVTFAETAAFTNKNAGTNKTVNVTGIALGGVDAGNYSLQNATATTTADVTPKPLDLAVTVADKIYDGTTAAIVTDYTLSGFVGSETVTAEAVSATFDTRFVGAGKSVSIAGVTLLDGANGGLAANYTIPVTSSTTATILPNPYAAAVVSSLTIDQAGVNGTAINSIASGSGALMLASNAGGPGSGNAAIEDTAQGLFDFGKTRSSATSALSLAINGMASPVRFATMGGTITLHLGTPEAAIAWPVTANIPVYLLKDGQVNQTLGSFNVVDNGSSLSLTTGFSAQHLPRIAGTTGQSASVALSLEGGGTVQLLANMMSDGTLMISLPSRGGFTLNDQALVLLGLAVGKQEFHSDINKIKAVVIRK